MRNPLTGKENNYYQRQLVLDGFGENAQLKLKEAKILVIGAGGLGCPVLQFLNAAGVGTIGIVDGDVIDISNLHRQLLYSMNDIGKQKAIVAEEILAQKNPFTDFKVYPVFLSTKNAIEIIEPYQLILDCTDNFAGRYLINDICVRLDKPFISGSIFAFTGQTSVFNYQDGPTYRCLFPEPPAAEDAPDCETAGVLGVLPGIIGNLMASEAIKLTAGIGEMLNGKLLQYDLLKQNFHAVHFKKNKEAVQQLKESPLWEDRQYEQFCNPSIKNNAVIKEITPEELKKMLKEKSDMQLIDVREPEEHELINIGGTLIPMNEIMSQVAQIEKDKQVILYCKVGMRSAITIQKLQEKFGFKNLYNLKGGIRAYLSS